MPPIPQSLSRYVGNLFLASFLRMYSRHGQWGSNTMAKNKNKQSSSKASGKKMKNMKKSQMGESSMAPVALTKVVKTQRPKVRSKANGDVRAVHREYIGEVMAEGSSPSLFKVQSFPINPGQAAVFPWLSKVAQNFESYSFRKLRFLYETEAPSSLGGTLVLAVDYDASDPAPISKQQALAFRSSIRSAPWNPCCFEADPEDLHKLKTNYVRPGAQPVNTDIKMYDIGNLSVITQGVSTGGATCGELYVEYDVDLITPVYEVVPTSSTVSATTVTVADPFGTAGTVISGNLISEVAGQVMSLTNLVIGEEYALLEGLPTTDIASFTLSASLVAVTNPLVLDGAKSGVTFKANASSGTITVVPTANNASAYYVVTQLPSGAGF